MRYPPRIAAVAALFAASGCASRPAAPEPPVAPVTTLAAAPDRFFTTDGVTLRYRDYGRGDPVVLLHGYVRSLDDWGMLGDSLAGSYRVIVLDQRGHGRSTRPAGAQQYGRRFAADVVRLLDHLRIPRAHLVGHSMGALVAARVATLEPARVSGVTLVAGPFYGDSAAVERETRRWADDLEQGRGFVNFVQWLFPGMPPQVAADISAEALRVNELPVLIAVMRSLGGLAVTGGGPRPVPALILSGTNDPLAPLSDSLARRWPGATLTIVPGRNHSDVTMSPELLAGLRRMLVAGRN